MVEVAFDTASEIAGVALTDQGKLVSELTWRTRQNHSRELLPALRWLLERAGLTKADISAVAVCTGPGSYAGLRVGLSTAKGLAYALDVPVAGVGRLAADALPLALAARRRVLAVHAAGRAELAWAAYRRADGGLAEEIGPKLGAREAFLAEVQQEDVVCGEIDEGLREEIALAGGVWAASPASRVLAVANLGWRRISSGDIDSADSLVPLYLREPAIGPQKPPAPGPSQQAGRG